MADALTLAAASLSTDLQRLATISHNLANATTPAYRREVVVTRPFSTQLDASALAAGLGAGAVADDSLATLSSVRHDLRPGTLRHTGIDLDLALEGDGWFELQAPDGPVYTRNGHFQRSASGVLQGVAGLPVLGQGGEVTLGDGPLRVAADGQVLEDGKPVAQLRVLRFAHPAALQPLGDGLFRPAAGVDGTPGAAGEPVADARLRQGYLENGNVAPVGEMVRLIETMRHAETSQRLVQNLDELLGHAIKTLGDR